MSAVGYYNITLILKFNTLLLRFGIANVLQFNCVLDVYIKLTEKSLTLATIIN